VSVDNAAAVDPQSLAAGGPTPSTHVVESIGVHTAEITLPANGPQSESAKSALMRAMWCSQSRSPLTISMGYNAWLGSQ